MTDKSATPGGIRDGMDWLVENTTSKDVATESISGHGFCDPRDEYYLATHEMDFERFLATAIPSEQIKQWLEESFPPCKRVMFLGLP